VVTHSERIACTTRWVKAGLETDAIVDVLLIKVLGANCNDRKTDVARLISQVSVDKGLPQLTPLLQDPLL